MADQTAVAPVDQAPPEVPPEHEVEYVPGGGDQVIDQAPAAPVAEQAPAQEKAEDTLNVLRPKAEARAWEFGPENVRRTYIQKPLSFIAKMQWFALVGEVLDRALSGPNAMSLNSLFEAPAARGGLSMESFRDADTFIQAVGKLMSVAPDFLVNSYCIWLNVPDYEREVVKQIMELPPDEGGLSDEQGIEIIEIFIDQNYEALDRFFQERLPALRDRLTDRAKQSGESRQSKR
jgi:hypothetical protein